MYDKYIKGKAIEKKINTFDGLGEGGFFIDFTEFKPESKKLTVHKTMQGIIKKAADAGVISKGIASSFKLGKITAPVVNGKIKVNNLEYENIKTKPAKRSRKKPLSIVSIVKEVYGFLLDKGYVASGKKGEINLNKKSYHSRILGGKITKQHRSFFLSDEKTKAIIQSSGGDHTKFILKRKLAKK